MKQPLPFGLTKSMVRYIRSIEPSLRPSTCKLYARTLTYWSQWASSAGISLTAMTRDDVVEACRWLYELNLKPSTRAFRLIVLRGYLRYLFIHDELAVNPDKIIHSYDMPKVPDCLPRSLSPSVDAELCRRLAQSNKPLWRGLLLMRKTGIRSGELRSMPYDCVRSDPHGNRYLKVPLGKLYNERLVPIDNQTFDLIESIRQLGPQPREWLLHTAWQRPPSHTLLQKALKMAVKGLEAQESEPITSHRLRHTYATTLLNAGMSLPAIQRLLGHRSIKMTLHYAVLNLNTLTREYNDALAKTRDRYETCFPVVNAPDDGPLSALVDTASRRLTREGSERAPTLRAQLLRLARRLRQIGAQLAELGL